jgi:hypothetical protein
MEQDVELNELPVHRTLADPVYRFRLYFVRLTDGDLAVVSFTGVLAWLLIQQFGYSHDKVLGLPLDPFGGFFVAIVGTLIFSFLHKVRPEGDIIQSVRGLREPKVLAPRSHAGDSHWAPSQRVAIVPGDYRTPLWKRKRLV